MKKRCTAAHVFCLLLTLASGVAYGEPLRLKVAYNPMPFNLPSIIERTWALLQQEGIEVEYESFTVGYAMSEAMAAGSLDIAPAMGLTSAVVARAGGRDIKITGVYSQAPAAFGLAVKPGTLDLGASWERASLYLSVQKPICSLPRFWLNKASPSGTSSW